MDLEFEPIEEKRRCGYRQVGKLYLIGEGLAVVCPSLPLEIKPCQHCGYEPKQYRDFAWISKDYVKEIREPTGIACFPKCPLCYPGTNELSQYGLMWAGKQYYTPESFIIEAKEKGVCKAIKQIPKGLSINETWIMLAHPEANKFQLAGYPEEKKPGIFYAFKPTRVEILLYRHQATDKRLEELKEKGITPILVDDKNPYHEPKRRRVKSRRNIA